MYEQLKNKLQQELKTLQRLQSKIDIISSSGKKIQSESYKEGSQKITGKSLFSLQHQKSFKRNLLKDFQKVKGLQDGQLFQEQLMRSKNLKSLSSQRKNNQKRKKLKEKITNPEKTQQIQAKLNSKVNRQQRIKQSLNGFSKEKQHQKITQAQRKKKLQIQLDLLKRARLLEKHLKRYGIKL